MSADERAAQFLREKGFELYQDGLSLRGRDPSGNGVMFTDSDQVILWAGWYGWESDSEAVRRSIAVSGSDFEAARMGISMTGWVDWFPRIGNEIELTNCSRTIACTVITSIRHEDGSSIEIIAKSSKRLESLREGECG